MTALQEQLGLVPDRAQADVLVIESVERPGTELTTPFPRLAAMQARLG